MLDKSSVYVLAEGMYWTKVTHQISTFRTFYCLSEGCVCVCVGGRGGVGGSEVFAGGQEMKIFSTVFRDSGKKMVGKQYFQH